MKVKGIILAGGHGTRLRPATLAINKHLLPVLNEPMILFPLRTLKTLGCNDILIVSGGDHIGGFAEFLKDGSEHGVSITYKVQNDATGIAAALALAEDFCAGFSDKIPVILGDNVYDNRMLAGAIYQKGLEKEDKIGKGDAVIFCKDMPGKEASRFGVVMGNGIVEKPKLDGGTAEVVTGLYVYPKDVFEVVKTLKPSARGELEITDVNNHYLKMGRCRKVGIKGFWSDAGTPESLFETIKWYHQSKI